LLGPGNTTGVVWDLVVYHGSLIAVGSFASADGVPASNIAAYTDLVTPVAISGFSAAWTGEAVSLDWVVDADEPLSGFEVYRRDGADADSWRRVGPAPLGPDARTWRDATVERGREYAYRVDALAASGARYRSPVERVRVPEATTALVDVVPNPFRASARIAFELAREGDVELAVYDALGRRVRVLVSGRRAAGRHVLTWDGRDAAGRAVASGVYFVRMRAVGYARTRKVVLLR